MTAHLQALPDSARAGGPCACGLKKLRASVLDRAERSSEEKSGGTRGRAKKPTNESNLNKNSELEPGGVSRAYTTCQPAINKKSVKWLLTVCYLQRKSRAWN